MRKRKKRPWPIPHPEKKLFPTHLFKLQGHWFYLFHALLFLLVLYPYVEVRGDARVPIILSMMNSIVMIFIVWFVINNWRQFFFAFLFAGPSMVIPWLPAFSFNHEIVVIANGLLFLYCIFMIIPYLIHIETIDADDIFAAISGYLLIGMMWAIIYEVLEISYPGSFYVDSHQNIDGIMSWSDYLFFSFTTLTTLGYGDITPVTSQARSLAIIEAITGVIFVAVMISRALALYISETIAQRYSKKLESEK